MPVIARWGNVVIKMYYRSGEHNPPHVHALSGSCAAAISIRTSDVLDGWLPPRVLARVRAWVRVHRGTLLDMWETQEFERLR